jgi:hypothetical protein
MSPRLSLTPIFDQLSSPPGHLLVEDLVTSDIPQIYDTLPPSAPPVAAPNATDDMELTNEL